MERINYILVVAIFSFPLAAFADALSYDYFQLSIGKSEVNEGYENHGFNSGYFSIKKCFQGESIMIGGVELERKKTYSGSTITDLNANMGTQHKVGSHTGLYWRGVVGVRDESDNGSLNVGAIFGVRHLFGEKIDTTIYVTSQNTLGAGVSLSALYNMSKNFSVGFVANKRRFESEAALIIKLDL